MDKNKGGRPKKLTALEEIAVVNEYYGGKDITKIAYEYGISYRTVSRIVKKDRERKSEDDKQKC